MVKPKFTRRREKAFRSEFSTEVLNPSICRKLHSVRRKQCWKAFCTSGEPGKTEEPLLHTIKGNFTAVIANENKGYIWEGGAVSVCFAAISRWQSALFLYRCNCWAERDNLYGGSVAAPGSVVLPIKSMQFIWTGRDSIPPYKEVPQVKPGLKEDVVMLRELGFKTQVQNLTPTMLLLMPTPWLFFVSGSKRQSGNRSGCSWYGVRWRGLFDGARRIEGWKPFERVYRQSPIAGSPFVKGDMVSLDLGFDDLQIVKRDSLIKNDSISDVDGS